MHSPCQQPWTRESEPTASRLPLARFARLSPLVGLFLALQACGGGGAVAAAPAADAQPSQAPIQLDRPPDRSALPRTNAPVVLPSEGSGALEAAEGALAGSASEKEGLPARPKLPVAAGGKRQASPPTAQPEAKTQAGAKVARDIEGAIAKGIARARERSKGKVHGNNCVVAVHVRSLGDDLELVSRMADAPLLPASNLKLITMAAALAELGAEHTIRTPFEAHGELVSGRLEGDLVARAAGDPLYFAGHNGSIQPWAEELAADLRAAGIESVSGDLVLDEGDFAVPAAGPAWPSSRDHWKEYCALAGGFSVNAGCLTALVDSAQPGATARTQLWPAGSGLTRSGTVKTGAKRSRLTVAVGATPGKATVRGSIPADVARYEARFAAPDPVELFGRSLLHALQQEGIRFDGTMRRERGLPPQASVAELRSALADSAVPILLDSNNSVADQVFLHLGLASGLGPTRSGGQAAVSAALLRLGVPTKGLVQVDGSGLSKDNRTSPRQLTALVAAAMARGGAEAALLRDSLPVAGQSGKLRKRMTKGSAKGRVRGKTGFVNGASGLSGLVETLDGRTLAYSILINYPHADGLNTHAFKPMQDDICEVLVNSEAPLKTAGAGR